MTRRRPGAVAATVAVAAVAAGGCGPGRSGRSAVPDARPPAAVEITMAATAFDPAVVRVPAGAPVTLLIRNTDPSGHDLRVDDLGVHLSVGAEEQVRAALLVDRPAVYPFYCSLPGHRAVGMAGTLWAG